MNKVKDDKSETWFAIIFGVLAIFLVKSLFENDNSKIVSKKGRKFLSDEKKMEEINTKINQSEQNSEHKEIFV